MSRHYLPHREGIFHFRIRVPNDLRTSLGATEIWRSLKTGDRRLAKELARPMELEAKRRFAQLRLATAGNAGLLA